MTNYLIRGECGGEEVVNCPDDDAARETLARFAEDAEFGVIDRPIFYTAYLFRFDDDGEVDEKIDEHTVRFDPPEPPCKKAEHDWKAPLKVVGGLAENPGVFGNGGGVLIKEVCAHCGRYRYTDTWYQRPDTGEQGLDAVYYGDPDEDSLAWVDAQEEAAIRALADSEGSWIALPTYRDADGSELYGPDEGSIGDAEFVGYRVVDKETGRPDLTRALYDDEDEAKKQADHQNYVWASFLV